jgi:hypothetical protein
MLKCPPLSPRPQKTPTAGAADYCGACACSLLDVFAPALAAAASSPEGAAALASSADPVSLASDVLAACVPPVLPAVLAAGIPLSALEGLTSCDFTGSAGTPVPSCLTERVAAITGGTATAAVEAAAGPASSSSIAAPLRVATVQELPGGGVSATLAGQLDDVQGLLSAFARNADLVAALPEKEASDLQRLAAAPESLASSPDTNAYLSTLSNPVDAVAAVSRLAEIDAAAPKPAAKGGSGAAAPATNGGSTEGGATSSAGTAAQLGASALLGAAMALFAVAI